MKAVLFEQFGGELSHADVADPTLPSGGVILKVEASGLCRSDWHGWMGHDDDVQLPHVPGHELAGVIVEVDSQVSKWQVGERVTVPFSMGCGTCGQCRAGDLQICDNFYQPGFKGWGSFAEYVALPFADSNLVRLPDSIDFVSAASLGCRFVTSYRAITAQSALSPGQWLAVHGCGGVGLSAIMIGKALDARILGVDVSDDALNLARLFGADQVFNARTTDAVDAIQSVTQGGAHVSIDAFGSSETCRNSIACLRKRGRHVQIGLMAGEHHAPSIPFGQIIAKELEIVGSHGMSAAEYPKLMELIANGKLRPHELVTRRISLAEVLTELPRVGQSPHFGITVIV
jgi:alcohol dehydrogenase